MARTAFLFPGQGSQFVGMGKKLCERSQLARQTFDEADAALGFKLSQLCFEGPAEKLTLTANTQPAILTHSIAAFRTLTQETGAKPVIVAGHSLGEYSALVAAGALSFSDAVRAVKNRGQWMQEAVPEGQGGMLALVGCDEAQADAFCREVREKSGQQGVFSVANLNGGGQVVVAGLKSLCQWAVDHLAELSVKPKRAIPLNVSAPFHCAMMKPAADKLGAHLKTLNIGKLSCGYIANVDAKSHQDAEGVIPRLIEQVCSPVRWEASMQTLLSSGVCDESWEVGPGTVLSGLLRRINRDAVCASKCSDE